MTLQEAIAADDVNELYRLIEEDENLLDRGSEGPFPNTPLHEAANKGNTKVAMEIAILKPSIARKLNRGGYSPMHLALQNKHYHTARSLMTLDPELMRVRGRGGITPLHFLAGEKGNNEQENVLLLELLAEFLYACQSSIEDLTSQCETAVHVAVKNHYLQAFKVLFGWLKRVHLTQILNWKDQDGNTVLHIAAFEGQQEIIKLLIGHTKVNAENFQNRTALEIIPVNVHIDADVKKRLRPRSPSTLSLSRHFSRELSIFEKYTNYLSIQDEATRNMILVVSSLIVTATYQAVLSPPGGYWQDASSNPPANSSSAATANSSGIAIEKPHQAGNIILSGSHLYAFIYLNSSAFLVSVASIAVAAITLWPHSLVIYFSLTFLSVAYCFFLIIEFPKSDKVVGSLLMDFFSILLSTTLALFSIMGVMHFRSVSRVDATRRRPGNILG